MNWKYTLKLKEDRDAYDNGEITLKELSGRIANKIKELPCFNSEEELPDIAYEFESCVETIEEFDQTMETLYDWGDTPLRTEAGKNCWVGFAF